MPALIVIAIIIFCTQFLLCGGTKNKRTKCIPLYLIVLMYGFALSVLIVSIIADDPLYLRAWAFIIGGGATFALIIDLLAWALFKLIQKKKRTNVESINSEDSRELIEQYVEVLTNSNGIEFEYDNHLYRIDNEMANQYVVWCFEFDAGAGTKIAIVKTPEEILELKCFNGRTLLEIDGDIIDMTVF